MNIIHCAATHRASAMAAKKIVYPAADRNKDPILQIIRQFIQHGKNQRLLDISSGTGQHLAYFAPHFPQVTFYPSEFEESLLPSIEAYSQNLPNVVSPVKIDVSADCETWPGDAFKKGSFDYIYNCNLVHVSPFSCSVGLFRNAGILLKPNGYLFTYGPYKIDGKITPESNVQFDRGIREQNPEWGLRDIRDLEKLAAANGISLVQMFDMPANNKTLIWQKTGDKS